MTRHETFTYRSSPLGALIHEFIEKITTPRAKSDVTIPADLANAIADTLRVMHNNIKNDVQLLGQAIAAGECPDRRADFFKKHFTDAATCVGAVHEAGDAVGIIRGQLNSTIMATDTATEAKPKRQPNGIIRDPATGAHVRTAKLYHDFEQTARALFRIDIDDDQHADGIIGHYKRGKEIAEALSTAGYVAPAEQDAFQRRIGERISKLQQDYSDICAEVNRIHTGHTGRLATANEIRELDDLQRREISINERIKALGGEMIAPVAA